MTTKTAKPDPERLALLEAGCVSPVLRDFVIGLNDDWDHSDRQKLAPFLPRLVGTADDGQDEARSYLALDWLIRTFAPAWLDLAEITAQAQNLRDLPRIKDQASVEQADPVVRAAREKAYEAWAMALDEARAGTLGDVLASGRAAGRSAGWAAGRAASWVTLRTTALEYSWVAALESSWISSWAAALDVSWAIARVAALDAAQGGAWDAVPSTIEDLQASALDLLDRMIDPCEEEKLTPAIDEAALAEVIERHEYMYAQCGCACGWEGAGTHSAHVAAVIATWLKDRARTQAETRNG